MIKLRIIQNNNYDYILEDNKGNIYNLNMEFYEV